MDREHSRILLVCLLFYSIFSVGFPIISAQDDLPGGEWSGPFVEKIRFKIAAEPDDDDEEVMFERYVQHLLEGEVDILSGAFKGEELAELIEADNIELGIGNRFGHGIAWTNCLKWPLSIAGVRRAISFALDKRKIQDFWASDFPGDSNLLHDSFIPREHPASVEDEMSFHYYDDDIPRGNEILDNLGFVDIDGDGWREGPNGDEIDSIVVSYVRPESAGPMSEIFADYIVDALHALNISAISERIYDSNIWWNRLHSLQFDFILGGVNYRRSLDSIINYWTYNYPDHFPGHYPGYWYNATWNSLKEVFSSSLDYDEIIETTKEMQYIWLEECPAIVLYKQKFFTAYRTDEFDGFVEHSLNGIPNYFTALKVHKKSGELIGGTFDWGVMGGPYGDGDDLISIPFVGPYPVDWYSEYNPMSLVYDSLTRLGPDFKDIDILAEDWRIENHADNPEIPEGHMRIIVDFRDNLTWSDGTRITPQDFTCTICLWKQELWNERYDRLWESYISGLQNITEIYPVSDTRFEVEFNTESWWHWRSICYLPIMPQYIESKLGEWYDVDSRSGSLIYKIDTISDVVVSGPFKPTAWIPYDYIEFTQNEYYWKNPRNWPELPTSTTTTSTTTGSFVVDIALALLVGSFSAVIVIAIGGFIIIKKS